jgi:AMIN domain
MPSFFNLGALMALATLFSAPLCAQTAAANSAQIASAKVQHVIVRGTGNTMEVEIQTSGKPVAPDTQAITGPDRIVVDFPGALPADELRALKVNSGALKGVRAGLFFSNPPITRIVLDLAKPQSYQISSIQNAVVVRLGPEKPGPEKLSSIKRAPVSTSGPNPSRLPAPSAAKLQNALLATGTNAAGPRISTVVSSLTPPPLPRVSEAPKPLVTVTFTNGMLRIHSDKATLAQVLFEVQLQTRAEIAIPAGAEQEQVAADLGPAPARDVLASLLNGSPYNFIFVGSEFSLERVILTRRDASTY